MRWRTAWVKNLVKRAEKHLGVALISFALGILFTASVGGDRTQVWVIVGAVGTVLGALGTLRPQRPAPVVIERPREAERVEDIPIISVTRVRGRGPQGVSLVLANAASSPVLFTEVHVYDDQEPMPLYARGGFLVPAGTERTETVPFDVNPLEGGLILFYFRYAPTGETLHRLRLPFTVRTVRRRKGAGDAVTIEEHDEYSFGLDDQRLASGDEAEKELADARHFWQEHPYRIVSIRPAASEE